MRSCKAFDAIKSGWISSKGSYVDQFERLLNTLRWIFSDNYKWDHSVRTRIKNIWIGRGDEVITKFFIAASINSIIGVGATPVVVDIEEDTWTIDIKKIKKNFKKKSNNAVHIYGQPCRLDEIIQIAKSKKYM